MHILIAPNAFKHSIGAAAAAEAIERGLKQSSLSFTATQFPIADGGDGTASLLLKQLGGEELPVEVHDPLGRRITAPMGLAENGKTAILELADASGLRLLKKEEFDPLHASSSGTGELIRHAMDRKVSRIILGIGGSATVDAAGGILESMGMRFFDRTEKPIKSMPAGLSGLCSIDLSNLDKRILETELIVLCDVENRLLGENGAASVFGPQKGASVEAVKILELCLARFREIALQQTGKDMAAIRHGGAAGGVAAGLAVFLGARLVEGIEYFLNVTGFDQAIEQADLLITGEGSIDRQTLEGKGPFGVAKRARKKGIPVIGLTGSLPIEPEPQLDQYFDLLMSINDQPVPLAEALSNTAPRLEKTSKALGDLLSASKGSFQI
jgi:glycerate 2-kinase